MESKKAAVQPLIMSPKEKGRKKGRKTNAIDYSYIKVNSWNDGENYFMNSMTSLVYVNKYPRTCTLKRKKKEERKSLLKMIQLDTQRATVWKRAK